MKTFILSVVLLLAGATLGVAEGNFDFDQLISESCNDYDNCEIEGKIGYLQDKSVNVIIYLMCNIQLSAYDRFTCYDSAYERSIQLEDSELIRGYEDKFSTQTIKSYYHYVTRTCRQFYCGVNATDCGESVEKCWKRLSIYLIEHIEAIQGLYP